jgi:nitrogen regulatory protein PII
MRHSRSLWLSAMLGVGAVAAVVLAAVASAGQVFRESFHEEETVVLENFCDVPGLTVEAAFVTDGRVHAVQHGRQEAPYFVEHVKRTEAYTNLANDKSVTAVVNTMTKDLRITDNGDGTITILVLATGNAVLYGEDGKALGRDPGQIRFKILIDTAGTPSDPSDDEFLAFLGVVKGSTGRSDDFCATAVPALS